jgi:hypothetical protein
LNSPAVFQAFVNDTLVVVHLNDILIFSKIHPEHILYVRKVLRCLLQSQLQWEFHVSQVSFLGHMISTASIKMDPVKVRAVTDWPRPASLKQVQRVLGFAGPERLTGHSGSSRDISPPDPSSFILILIVPSW